MKTTCEYCKTDIIDTGDGVIVIRYDYYTGVHYFCGEICAQKWDMEKIVEVYLPR